MIRSNDQVKTEKVERTPDLNDLPRPHIKKTHWTTLLIWLTPLLAAGLAAYYGYTHFQDAGQDIVIRFTDGSGLKAGETMVSHLGVPIGKVKTIGLDDEKKLVLVTITLQRSQEVFAKEGATYWTVRPQLSVENVSGLNTLLSGPYIEATPGNGAPATQFDGLQKAPSETGLGASYVLHAPRLDHLSVDAPVYYRGIEVGNIRNVQLSPDATGVDVTIFVHWRYTVLVQSDSKFWIMKAADIKGGLFSGVQFKLGPLQSLVTGGIAFATPENGDGFVAKDGSAFPLYDDSKKEWLDWSPRIQLPPPAAETSKKAPEPPHTP